MRHLATIAIPATLLSLSAAARNPIHLSANPPKVQLDDGPSLSLGRVGLDPSPGGLRRTEPQSNLFYFQTKGTRPIEPVPGIVLRIPLGTTGR
jgi:hypothetical protein